MGQLHMQLTQPHQHLHQCRPLRLELGLEYLWSQVVGHSQLLQLHQPQQQVHRMVQKACPVGRELQGVRRAQRLLLLLQLL